MTTTNEQMYLYIPGRASAQDAAAKNQEGQYVGLYSGKTLEVYQREYPDIMLVTFEELEKHILEACKTPVIEIDVDKYHEALEVMPPLNWRTEDGNSSFMLCEMYTMDITDIYAQMSTGESGRRYFSFRDQVSLSQKEIYQRCRDYIAAR